MPSNKVSPRAGGHFPCRPKLALAFAVVFVLVCAVAGASYKASYGQDYEYGHDEPDYGYETHRYPKATYADSYKVKDYSLGSSYGQGYSKTSYKHEPRGYGYDDHKQSYGSQYGDQGYGHSGYEHETYDSYEEPSYRNKRSVDYSRGSSYGHGYSKTSYKHEPAYGHEYSRESYKHEPSGYGYDEHKQSYGSQYRDEGYGHAAYEHETYDSYVKPSYRNKRSADKPIPKPVALRDILGQSQEREAKNGEILGCIDCTGGTCFVDDSGSCHFCCIWGFDGQCEHCDYWPLNCC